MGLMYDTVYPVLQTILQTIAKCVRIVDNHSNRNLDSMIDGLQGIHFEDILQIACQLLALCPNFGIHCP